MTQYIASPNSATWLFVAGDRPDRFAKAALSGADEVICDLEDAVAESSKQAARQHVAQWLAHGGQAWVRVNATATSLYALDIEELAGQAGLRGVIVPKAEDPAALTDLSRQLGPGTGIIALIETATGVLRAAAIGRCQAVTGLAFGSIDFAADIDAAHDDEALLTARTALVQASRAAGKPAPIDGVTVDLDRADAAGQDAALARRLGFGGKLFIHPAQVPAVGRAFRPSAEELTAAMAIVDRAKTLNGDGAGRYDGQMIDEASIGRARKTFAPAASSRPGATPSPSRNPLPLCGLTVVALEQAVAAPFASRQLADLGARVIKIERPGSGDFARDYDHTVNGQASYFVWLNRGKESVELDVKSALGRQTLEAILARADVFIQNLAPGAANRLGLGAAELRARYPRLICCSISGYGPDGPYTHKKAYDLLVQCETGLLSVTGTPGQPCKAGISVADIAAGMYAYSGVLTALYEREKSGHGSTLDVAMLDALGEWMSQPYYYNVHGAQPTRRTGARHASISPYGPYSAAGGQVFLGLQNEREWAVLCNQVLGMPTLIQDQRFRTNTDRVANDAELTTIIEHALRSMTPDEVADILETAGIANARLRTPAEFAAHPQLAARQRWREVDTPAGKVRALLPPVSLHGREAAMGAVPALGEHTAAVMAEFTSEVI